MNIKRQEFRPFRMRDAMCDGQTERCNRRLTDGQTALIAAVAAKKGVNAYQTGAPAPAQERIR